MKLTTETGDVTFLEPDRKRLEKVGAFIGVAGPMPEKPGGADYGIVMKRGNGERWAYKQQPVDVKRAQEREMSIVNLALVVLTIHRYLKLGFTGVLMPCVYMRPKPKGMAEVGIAYFGGADPSNARARRGKDPLDGLDPHDLHGAGFGKMVTAFMDCLAETAEETGINLFKTIDVDHRPRSALDLLTFSFLIHGQDVYSLKINPHPEDPVWEWLRGTGISQVYALPSVPLEIPDECRNGASKVRPPSSGSLGHHLSHTRCYDEATNRQWKKPEGDRP
jgi:hypothetical protein